MTDFERYLTWLLRLAGGVTVMATFAIFLPLDWMAATHQALGLGSFPPTPLVEYLTRSLSGLYAVHGGVLLVASTDVRRYRGVIKYLGLAGCTFGVVITAIDIKAGMPLFWTVSEGPPVVLLNLAILALLGRIPKITR